MWNAVAQKSAMRCDPQMTQMAQMNAVCWIWQQAQCTDMLSRPRLVLIDPVRPTFGDLLQAVDPIN